MVYLKMFWQLLLASPAILKLIKTIAYEAKKAEVEIKINEKFKGLNEAINTKDKQKAAEKFNSIFNS